MQETCRVLQGGMLRFTAVFVAQNLLDQFVFANIPDYMYSAWSHRWLLPNTWQQDLLCLAGCSE